MVARIAAVTGGILFVLALPAALSLTNFRWFAFQPANYVDGQARHRVPDATGLSTSELLAIDRALVRYLGSDRDSFRAALDAEGVVRSPFSDRDIAHMRDVHDLVAAVLRIHLLATIAAIGFLVVALLSRQRRLVARCLIGGSFLTLAVLGLLGILSALDWEAVFLRFHFLSFSNDLWRLDPARDALIRLYPPGFFLDATIRLVVMSVVEATALIGLGLALLWHEKRRQGKVT